MKAGKVNWLIDDVMRQYIASFTPTEDEKIKFRTRLNECTLEELGNLQKNFAFFGVKEVLQCIYSFRD